MTTFDTREQSFETKFALDEETRFKAESRACKALGLWAAERFGLSGDQAETYAKTVVAANLSDPGFEDVTAKVLQDAQARGTPLNPKDLHAVLESAFARAVKDLKAG